MQPENIKSKKSVVIVPSALPTTEGEETEITAQISVPEEGGWGWVIMVTSFTSICLMDGVIFTFGAIFADIRDDMNVQESLVVLINSVTFALYFLAGPIASAIINRYGFRECTMAGSVICCIALVTSYFAPNYITLIFFYGIVNGFGACLINMASGLVVGFYFEKLRSIVMAISGSGSSVGVMIFFSVNSYLTKLAGWRITTLFHAGMFGLIYFLGMTYRPLVSLFITKTEEARTLTYLPDVSKQNISKRTLTKEDKGDNTTVTERMFREVSSSRYPTAQVIVKEGVIQDVSEAGTSSEPAPRVTMTAHSPSGMNHRQIKSLQNMISGVQTGGSKHLPGEITLQVKTAKKKKTKCCHWEKNVPEARPMYRDDAFYGGAVTKLDAYKKSVMDIPLESRTGLEYQMAVTRAATVADIEQRKGICTTAFKRVFVSMIDPKLLKRFSFILLCCSAFSIYLGLLVVYVFLTERNRLEGMASEHCSMLLSVIGFTSLVGRLILGAIAIKLDPLKIYATACIMSGIATILSNLSFNIYYQYGCAIVFGFFISSLVTLRSMVLVKLYGLEVLTNATGLMVVFQGLGSLISTPLGSIIRIYCGFYVTFYLAGACMIISGLIFIPIQIFVNIENKATTHTKKSQPKSDPHKSLKI